MTSDSSHNSKGLSSPRAILMDRIKLFCTHHSDSFALDFMELERRDTNNDRD